MDTALLLIDIQESFRHRPYFRAESLAPFLARTNALIDACTSRSVPVVRILHADSDDPKNPFSLASGLVRPLEGLAPVGAAAQFVKARHSALVGTGLSVWLRKNGIGRLIDSYAEGLIETSEFAPRLARRKERVAVLATQAHDLAAGRASRLGERPTTDQWAPGRLRGHGAGAAGPPRLGDPTWYHTHVGQTGRDRPRPGQRGLHNRAWSARLRPESHDYATLWEA